MHPEFKRKLMRMGESKSLPRREREKEMEKVEEINRIQTLTIITSLSRIFNEKAR